MSQNIKGFWKRNFCNQHL